MKHPDIRIMIVEDQTILREALSTILEMEPGIRVVGMHSDAESVLEALGKINADVVLMDIRLPGKSGIEACREIVESDCDSRVIMLTTFDEDDFLYQAVEAGASAFLLKDLPAEQLISSIRRVCRGETVLPEKSTTRLLRNLVSTAVGDILTERQLVILGLIAEGLSNRDIATRVFLSEGTVRNQVSEILAKLGADNRTHAVSIASERGLF